jgi:predicted nucleotidyltransferase
VFTEGRRAELTSELTEHARADPTVTAAALVGSAARQATDEWSDIDLSLRLDPHADPLATADSWQTYLASKHDVVDHLDIWAGAGLYRVFLLADSLQIDISFWPADAFASNGEPFELLFGEANKQSPPDVLQVREIIGWAWLYALHARSAIARGRPWQALSMIDGLRDRIASLACVRHGLPAHQGRGIDQLPETVLSRLSGGLVASPDCDLLAAALSQLLDLLVSEVEAIDHHLAGRLRPALTVLVQTANGRGGANVRTIEGQGPQLCGR